MIQLMMRTTMRWGTGYAISIIVSIILLDSRRNALAQTTAPTASTVPVLFADEFEGPTLNLKKWYRCYPDADETVGCSNNPGQELEWYQPGNVIVSDGFLHLVAREQETKPKFPYTSGLISTGGRLKPLFAFKYGYMEMRAKLPPGKGMWPAFWALPADGTWPPEIDVVEGQGETSSIDYLSVHWRDERTEDKEDETKYDTGTDLSTGFHTYGLDWESNTITWYFDRHPVKTFSKTALIPHKPMYVIVNLAVGGWISFPDRNTTHFPAEMLVDYVRVWRRKPF
jgi:beta-glucanase (GH16 family)